MKKSLYTVLSLCLIFGTYNPLTIKAEEADEFASSTLVENPTIDDGFTDSFEYDDTFTDETSTFYDANDDTTTNDENYADVDDFIEYMYTDSDKTLHFRLKAGVSSAGMPNYKYGGSGTWTDYASKVEKIDIEEGITSIGDNDFKKTVVGDETYYGNLNEVKLPSTVTSIGATAFGGVSTLKTIDLKNVTSIGASAFNRTGLESISFLGNVTLGSSAFSTCENLSSVSVDGNLSVGNYGFNDCRELKIITCKELILSNIKGKEFYGCTALTSLNYENKLTKIHKYSFYGVPLSEFDFSEVTSVGSHAFEKAGLKKIAFGQKEITISAGAFDGCNELTSVCYPGSKSEWDDVSTKITLTENVKLHCKADTIEAKEATCTETGWKEVGYCEACGEHYSYENDENKLAALGHDFVVSDSKEATCTEVGYITKTCNNCGETTTEEIEPLGHDFEKDYTVDVKATCTTDGKQSKHCSRCDAKEDEQKIAALGHDFAKDYTVDVKATCTTDGEQSKHCSRCDAKEDVQKIAALGHDFTSKVTKEATCTADGVITKSCSRCDATETEAIKATGHKFGDWKVTAEATVFVPEQQERICETCGEKETKTVGTALKAAATVNASSVKLKVKQSTSGLKVTGLAKGDSVKTWKSTNTKIFTVKGSENGTCKLTAKKAGTAKLQITLASGLKKTVTVKVQKSNVKTTKVSVSSKNVSVKKGKKVTLKPVVTPFTSKQKVTYTSSNKKVATVSAKGVITGKKKGTAKITIKSGSKSVKVTVRVK